MLEDLTTLNTILMDGSTLVLVALSLMLTGKLVSPVVERVVVAARARKSMPPAPASSN